MTTLTFASALSAGKLIPLQKVIKRLGGGATEVIPYPGTYFFTTRSVVVQGLDEFASALRAAGDRGECMFKGNVTKQLLDEPRGGAISNEDITDWVCLDFDHIPKLEDIDDVLGEIDDLAHTSYIIQYTSSHKIDGRFSAHVFMLLDRPLPSKSLEAWLVHLNLTEAVLAQHIKLSATGTRITWPLDHVVARNTQIIYIAPPRFEGMRDPVAGKRIVVVNRKRPKLVVPKMPEREKVMKEARKKLRTLRDDDDLPPIKYRTTDGQTVISNVNATVTGIVDVSDRYVRVNLNGGDSAAYWFWRHDPTLLYSFKDDTEVYRLEELDHKFYRQYVESDSFKAIHEKQLVAFMEPGTTTGYRIGMYEPREKEFYIDEEIINEPVVMSRDKFNETLRSLGVNPKNMVIHVGSVVYDPAEINVRFDPKRNRVNRFRSTQYMHAQPKVGEFTEVCPHIDVLLASALGEPLIVDHFLKWLSYLLKNRTHVGTGWLIQGAQGTGKSMLVNHVLKPLVGESNFVTISSNDLADRFNDYVAEKLLVFLDEADLNRASIGMSFISSRLKSIVGNRRTAVRKLYKAVQSMENHSNLIMATNVMNAVSLSMDDRRFNVGSYQLEPLKKRGVNTDALVKMLPKELDALASWLMACNVDSNTVEQPIQTVAKTLIQEHTMPSAEHVTRLILQDTIEPLFEYITREWVAGNYDVTAAYEKVLMKWLHQPSGWATREELMAVYRFHVPKFTKDYSGPISEGQFLAKQGFEQKLKKIDGKTYRLYELKFNEGAFSALRKMFPLEKAKVIQIKSKEKGSGSGG